MTDKLPQSGSRNPVLGVVRCTCGQVATVHRPKGKRAAYLYTICPDCGTDQRTGKPFQNWISETMVDDVAKLDPIGLQAEPQTEPEPEIKVDLTETETEITDIQTEPEAKQAEPEPLPLPKQEAPDPEKKTAGRSPWPALVGALFGLILLLYSEWKRSKEIEVTQ